jgi:serine/threonine protein kinase
MTDPLSPSRLGDFDLLEQIGASPLGSLYRARCRRSDHPRLLDGEEVALKRLSGDVFGGEEAFRRQAERLLALRHPHLVGYGDAFAAGDPGQEVEHALVMEWLDGESLDRVLEGYPEGLSWSKAQRFFLEALDGLAAAEGAGVVHGNLKPSNLFLLRDGSAKVIDFSLARAAESGEATSGGWRGALDFLAPDFVSEKHFGGDTLSDLYSLGVVFFRALSGHLPFSAFSANASFEYFARWSTNKETSYPLGEVLLQKNFRKLKRCVQLLPGLHDFLLKALCPVRSGRFQSFAEMRAALAAIGYARVQGAFQTYELVDLLGQGGFGKVFLGRVVETGEYVAIKQLLSALNERRFAREADMLRKFGHPNIVNYIELVQSAEGGGPDLRSYLVMENLPGMPQWSLRNRLKAAPGGIDPATGLHIFARYLLALNHLHRNGIIHRDIKPANLYAPEDDVAHTKIFDFGIARESDSTLTQGSAPGTLDFMAPEFALQRDFKGSPVSDIYSLGLCFYETLTGKAPFDRLSQSKMPVEAAFYMRAQSKPMPTFDHPVFRQYPALVELMRKALHYNPRLRYRTAYAMLADLDAILAGITGAPTGLLEGVSPPEQAPEPERIAEYEQTPEPGLLDEPEESLDTLSTAFTGHTPNIVSPRPSSEVSAGDRDAPELDTSPTAKAGPPVGGYTPAPVELLDPTERVSAPRAPPTPPSLPTRRGNPLAWVAALIVLAGAGGGGLWWMTTQRGPDPGQVLEQRLAALLPTEAPDPAQAPLAEWRQAREEADAWLEQHPEADAIARHEEELRRLGRAWPKDLENAVADAVRAGDAPRAARLVEAFAAVSAPETLTFLGLTSRTHERRLEALREQAASLAAAPVPPVVAAPTPVPAAPEPPPPPVPTPEVTQVKPGPMTPPVAPPPPDLTAPLHALREASAPALEALRAAATPTAVQSALDALAAVWAPALGEVKTRALGESWWNERAEAAAAAIRRAAEPERAEGRAERLRALRRLLDHELLSDWLTPEVFAALRGEQEAREALCWVEVVNESGRDAQIRGGGGLSLPPTRLAAGETQPLRLPAGTQPGTVIAQAVEPGFAPRNLELQPVPGGGIRLSIPEFMPSLGGLKLAARPAGVQAQVFDAAGTAVPEAHWASLPDGEYVVQYNRPDHQPQRVAVRVASGELREVPAPEAERWAPTPALATLRAVPASLDELEPAALAQLAAALDALALTDPAHQAQWRDTLARVRAAAARPPPAPPAPGGDPVVQAWRDYFCQVGVFNGLAVVLRGEDRRAETRPGTAPAAAAGSSPAAQRQEAWHQVAASKASRVERETLAARFEEIARAAEAAGQAELALECRVDAEVLRSRRRRQPARELLDKAPYLAKVRAHTMFAGPEGLSGGVSPQETLRDLLTYARSGGALNAYDALLACYATYFAWRPSLTEPEENRRKFANDPDYQRNIADMRKLNLETARQLAELLARVDAAGAGAAGEALLRDADAGPWLLAAMPRFLAAGHPLHAAGRQWLSANPVDRVDRNATLDHVGLEMQYP